MLFTKGFLYLCLLVFQNLTLLNKLKIGSCCSGGMKNLVFVVVCSLIIAACNSINPLKNAFTETPPYEQYVKSLEKAGLKETPMARAWINAGERVFQDSVILHLPFSESGFFEAGEPGARSFRFDVKEGQVLTVEGQVIAEKNGRAFLDLFVWEDNQWEQLAHADSTLTIQREFRKDYKCLLRLQPELLSNTYYTISISLTPVLINPVSGATNKSIGSFYGADRDGGRRKHEGVDIFAKKGTPVVAPVDGYVSRVGSSNLGGKVVWMRDQDRGHSYYFAHLDEQLVQSGEKVRQGDTLGLVGNTGNARTTPPHLHFGIYQRGSKDPIHFIQTLEATMASPLDTTFQPEAFKVVAQKVNLRSGPGAQHVAIGQLVQETFVKIISQSGEWYRIALPDKKQGFVHKSLITPVVTGKELYLTEPAVVLSEARADAVPVSFLESAKKVEVLARFGDYGYVRTEEGLVGWLLI